MRLPLRLGTRGSPLALAQADITRAALIAAHPDLAAEGAVEIVVVKTTGDRVQDRRLEEIGGKGLFTKELEEGLLDGRLDIAVHSMKDMETALPDGLVVAAVLPRADPRDVLIGASSLGAIPRGGVVGTASLRRAAQVLARRPDLRVETLRGSVQTRLRKLAEGRFAATLLARAGLDRLGMEPEPSALLEPEEMLPAVAQGAIAIEARADDEATRALLLRIDDPASHACVRAERALLAGLDGSCRTPIAGLARLGGTELALDGLVAAPDGSDLRRASLAGSVADAAGLGAELARRLRP